MIRTAQRGFLSEINVVPYVDVMLVLLVIFMVTAPLLTQGIVVDLPDVPASTLEVPAEPLVLSVDREGRFYLNFGGDPAVPLDDRAVLERAAVVVGNDADTPLFVRGDEGAVHGRVMRGFALLQQAGARRAVLVTEIEAVGP